MTFPRIHICISPPTLTLAITLAIRTPKAFWHRALDCICAPRGAQLCLGRYAFASNSLGLARSIETALCAFTYSARCDLLKPTGPGYQLSKIGHCEGIDEHGALDCVVGVVGAVLGLGECTAGAAEMARLGYGRGHDSGSSVVQHPLLPPLDSASGRVSLSRLFSDSLRQAVLYPDDRRALLEAPSTSSVDCVVQEPMRFSNDEIAGREPLSAQPPSPSTDHLPPHVIMARPQETWCEVGAGGASNEWLFLFMHRQHRGVLSLPLMQIIAGCLATHAGAASCLDAAPRGGGGGGALEHQPRGGAALDPEGLLSTIRVLAIASLGQIAVEAVLRHSTRVRGRGGEFTGPAELLVGARRGPLIARDVAMHLDPAMLAYLPLLRAVERHVLGSYFSFPPGGGGGGEAAVMSEGECGEALLDWAAWLRLALHCVYRSKCGVLPPPDGLFVPVEGGVGGGGKMDVAGKAGGAAGVAGDNGERGDFRRFNLASSYPSLLLLDALLQGPAQAALLRYLAAWIDAALREGDGGAAGPRQEEAVVLSAPQVHPRRGPFSLPEWAPSRDLLRLQLRWPRVFAARSLVRLPKAYTSFHTAVKGRCPFELPAVCLCCGAIVDGNAKGKATMHARQCSADAGVIFLLQEGAIALLHGDRASYFPSPYVDENGERQKSSRGKPLFRDDLRMAYLDHLWRGHAVPREVIAKRSTSNRVIIAGHY